MQKNFTDMPEQSWKQWLCYTSYEVNNSCLNNSLNDPYFFLFWNYCSLSCHTPRQTRYFLPLHMTEIWITFHYCNRFNVDPCIPTFDKETRRNLKLPGLGLQSFSTVETWLRVDCIQEWMLSCTLCTCKGTHIQTISLKILFVGFLPAVL